MQKLRHNPRRKSIRDRSELNVHSHSGKVSSSFEVHCVDCVDKRTTQSHSCIFICRTIHLIQDQLAHTFHLHRVRLSNSMLDTTFDLLVLGLLDYE